METPKPNCKRQLSENKLGQICWGRMSNPFDSPGDHRLVDGSPISDTARYKKKRQTPNDSPIVVVVGNNPNITPPP